MLYFILLEENWSRFFFFLIKQLIRNFVNLSINTFVAITVNVPGGAVKPKVTSCN